ncbi:serine hydrolase domain-containing protein [Rhizohabitans arisaemae]|uniref:serine hydrolase domain-containing protein n=1 Tax=Rhizohabitans arisaemae TaxID=2720610 RepID=UPI0024B0C119|nr:serine hydrolase domain-containing protein [Rhizohabitans arisaemae]
MRVRLPLTLAAIALLAVGAATLVHSSRSPAGVPERPALSAADLTGGAPAGPVPDQAFAVPADAAGPAHTFQGRLILDGESAEGGFRVVQDEFDNAGSGDNPVRHLPDISLEFVQDGGELIPAVQGLVYTGHPGWNLIVGPGRAWRQGGDGDRSRAAFPFTLVSRNQNCTHNGSMTFLYDAATVSRVRYQVTQETCPYFKFDMWGQPAARYQPYPVKDADAIKAAHAAEVAARLPVKPFERLAEDHPGVDPAAFTKGIGPDHLTAHGLFYKGVHYVAGCRTRHGTYAFCENMRLPSFSTAKTAFAAVAHMRLAQRYGPEVSTEPIEAHLPELKNAAGDWTGVTFEHGVDLATGNHASAAFMDDENASVGRFFNAESYGDKTAAAIGYPRRSDPGTRWVYHTSDTFLVTQAMANYLRKRTDESADLFRMVSDEVYKPIKLSAGTRAQTLRTDNKPDGAPHGGAGLFWIADDLAKTAKLLNDDRGKADGVQLLHPGELDSAMQRDPADRGLPSGPSGAGFYNNGTPAEVFTPAAFPQYTCTFHVPYMSGFGGITVAMMPNGVTFYYISDNNEYAWADAVHTANRISPHCP